MARVHAERDEELLCQGYCLHKQKCVTKPGGRGVVGEGDNGKGPLDLLCHALRLLTLHIVDPYIQQYKSYNLKTLNPEELLVAGHWGDGND